MLKAEYKSSGSFSLGRKVLDFIDAELKNLVSRLQLAAEIELYPENSVITRYWNIELVNDNRAWIPRLIELHGPTLTEFHITIPNLCVIDFNLFGLKLSPRLGCTDHEAPSVKQV